MLPWFGGSSSVWATSLLFFTGMLFLGYLYVYFLQRYHDALQAKIHLVVLIVSAALVLLALLVWHSVYPPLQWTIGNELTPWLEVLAALFISVGIPYFLLATTGPLLQYWYGISAGKEPYKLYALSNIGSLLALASYPFAVEPHMVLAAQKSVWILAFLVYVALLFMVCRQFLKTKASQPQESEPVSHASVPMEDRVIWVTLAALPSLMLVATTTQITQVIAPIPLLWLLPLCVYLITFIIAFWGLGRGFITWFLLLGTAAATYSFLDSGYHETAWRVISDILLLFFIGLFCHGQLYARRPETKHSPLFYLNISLGGMIGALLASLVAPLFFPDLWEFPLGILLCALFAIALIPRSITARVHPVYITIARVMLLIAICSGVVSYVNDENGVEDIVRFRNFYGTAKVNQVGQIRTLLHGGTIHGMQFLDPELEFTPSTYYSAQSGVARAIMDQYLANRDKTLNIGIIGLGTGAISTYCGSGDKYVFYEIDPQIVNIAHTQFTYLTRCPGVEIRLGDARIVLEEERRAGVKNNFDVLVMDAFNDDTIPVHLVTRNALQTFLTHLRSDESILAVHTSNRYLDLAPAIISTAEDLGLYWMIVENRGEENEIASPSEWVLLTRSEKTYRSETFENLDLWYPEKRVPVWTDDYSDMLAIISIPFDFNDLVDSFREKLGIEKEEVVEETVPEEEVTEEVTEE
ncbi:MAG: hypothetical protein G01um10148_757 [Parcubacteria group bacterium Gr01-1014_8]|nr:MAG: hypothetical protein G01um10148_757 [Parcubacteria group bacterium Gr01-1014_8]